MTKLRLRGESTDDLKIISAALQDAILKVGEIRYSAKTRSLTLRMTRFRHEGNVSERILCGLRIDGVLSLKSKGLDRQDPEAMAVLLSLTYAEGDAPPGGNLNMVFAGNGEIRAQVEVLDLILTDVAEPRATDKSPLHPIDE